MKCSARVWLMALICAWAAAPWANAQVTEQSAGNVVGTGDSAWKFLLMEGESYDFDKDGDDTKGFTRIDTSESMTSPNGYFELPANANASGGAALFALSPSFGLHADKVTYHVKFAHPGTYYMFMHITAFDIQTPMNGYLSEDSFYMPPSFNADPETDWPGGGQQGYTEGCCANNGFWFIPNSEGGTDARNGAPADPENPYWEGNFHWTGALRTSQFLAPNLNPATTLTYEVTQADVGQVLDFTVDYREPSLAIDAWLFTTEKDLLSLYSQDELDQLVLGTSPGKATDLNHDNAVDAADAGLMFADWGGPGSTSAADFNKDGFVDAADAGTMFADWTGDPNTPAANAATAEYNSVTGELKVSSAGAVNLFVQSAGSHITPLNPAPAVPVGLLTNNASRVGITNLGPINVSNFSFGNIGVGLAQSDLKLVYTPALGQKGIEVAAGSEAFRYIPEPASFGLIGLGLAGMLVTRRRN